MVNLQVKPLTIGKNHESIYNLNTVNGKNQW